MEWRDEGPRRLFCRTALEAEASKTSRSWPDRMRGRVQGWPRSTESLVLARNGRARAAGVSSGGESNQGGGEASKTFWRSQVFQRFRRIPPGFFSLHTFSCCVPHPSHGAASIN